LNEEKRYKIQFIDSEEDVTRTVRLSLRSLRVLAVGAGAAGALPPPRGALKVVRQITV